MKIENLEEINGMDDEAVLDQLALRQGCVPYRRQGIAFYRDRRLLPIGHNITSPAHQLYRTRMDRQAVLFYRKHLGKDAGAQAFPEKWESVIELR